MEKSFLGDRKRPRKVQNLRSRLWASKKEIPPLAQVKPGDSHGPEVKIWRRIYCEGQQLPGEKGCRHWFFCHTTCFSHGTDLSNVERQTANIRPIWCTWRYKRVSPWLYRSGHPLFTLTDYCWPNSRARYSFVADVGLSVIRCPSSCHISNNKRGALADCKTAWDRVSQQFYFRKPRRV